MSDGGYWPCCGAPAWLYPKGCPPDDSKPTSMAYTGEKQLCVNTLIWHPDRGGRVLLVSRKDDRTKFCLPGGKVDPADWGERGLPPKRWEPRPNPEEWATRASGMLIPAIPEISMKEWHDDMEARVDEACLLAACRETLEESGVIVQPGDLHRLFGSSCYDDGRKNNRYAVTYVARAFHGTLGTDEPIDVKWGSPSEALAGPFGDLYTRVFSRYETVN